NNETTNTRTNNNRSSKKIDSSGRPVKGRGFMRYTGKSRSRSRTPPHWRHAIEDRNRFSDRNEFRKQDTNENIENDHKRKRVDEEKHDNNREDRYSRRNDRRKDDHRSSESSRHKYQRKSTSPDHQQQQRSNNIKQKENDTSNIIRKTPSPSNRHSSRNRSPLSSSTNDRESFFSMMGDGERTREGGGVFERR
ncbi:unnamed protein product, partial [Adineta steineri]